METKEPMASGQQDEDLYADGADGGDETKSPEKTGDDQPDDATEAVLPKSIMAGKKFNVGDKVELEITGIHDEQYSVKYSMGDGDDASKDPDSDGDMDKAAMPAGMGGGDTDYD